MPDIDAKAEGRGVWITLSEASVNEAVKKKAFSKSLKTELKVPEDLAELTRTRLEQRVFGALKRGGVYGVVDHSAKDGTGNEAAKSLHRIDKALVVKEVTSAGFKLAKEGAMLRRADDTRDFSVTKERGRSDRFVLAFEKP